MGKGVNKLLFTAKRFLVFQLVLGATLSAGTLIVLEAGKDRTVLERHARELRTQLGLNPSVQKSAEGYRLAVGPLSSNESTAVLYYTLKKKFPAAVALEQKETFPVHRHETSRGTADTQGEPSQEYRLWIALFALALTGILALFFSSRKLQQITLRHEGIRKRHEEIERRFNDHFRRLGENIYRLSKDVVQCTSSMANEVEDSAMGERLRKVAQTESKILNTTSNLLEFLRLKAKKVVIKKERFEIDNVLEDVVESLVPRQEDLRSTKTELIFDIDKEVPRHFVGDFVRIGEVLSKLLENATEKACETEVRLEVGVYKPFTGKMGLQFKIIYFPEHEDEDLEEYFVPVYDEKSGEYRRLGNFVAHELTQLMEGNISVARNSQLGQVIIEVTIPVESAQGKEQRKYRLNRREYIKKDVLIVNRNYDASLAIKKMFSYFRHNVKVLDAELFETRRPPLDTYDIFVIEEHLIDGQLAGYLREIRASKEIKVVGLRNFFASERLQCDPDLIDIRETKPLNFQRVLGIINDLYEVQKGRAEEEKVPETGKQEEKKREFWSDIYETPDVTLKSFGDFAGAKIMAVEDNEINLRMLLKILRESGIEILSALNGEEAVEMIKNAPEEKVELILMDINMPVMDGLTATEKIRQLPGGDTLPIVALSALHLETEMERMKRVEMDGYLPKPLNIGQLYTVFNRYLKRRIDISADASNDVRQLPKLEGVVLEEAIQHTQGSEVLLKEILEEFLEGYGNSDVTLKDLNAKGDYLAFRQMTVDLLGLTGTIGATELFQILKEIYKVQLYDRRDEVPEYLERYSEAMERVRRSLNRYLGREK